MAAGNDNVEMGPATEITYSDPKVAAALHDHGDAALDFLETHEPVTFTPEEEKSFVWKIDRVLVPLVSHLAKEI
jgi:hypothetical protein